MYTCFLSKHCSTDGNIAFSSRESNQHQFEWQVTNGACYRGCEKIYCDRLWLAPVVIPPNQHSVQHLSLKETTLTRTLSWTSLFFNLSVNGRLWSHECRIQSFMSSLLWLHSISLVSIPTIFFHQSACCTSLCLLIFMRSSLLLLPYPVGHYFLIVPYSSQIIKFLIKIIAMHPISYWQPLS